MSAIGKIALTISLVLVIVGAVLWSLGGKQSEYSTRLSIAAPPEAIFPYLTQPDRLKSWTDGLVEVSEFRPMPKVDGMPMDLRLILKIRLFVTKRIFPSQFSQPPRNKS